MHYLPKAQTMTDDELQTEANKAIMRYEAKLGGQVFGPIPQGHHREFFCLDEFTWVWREVWTDVLGHEQKVTTYYQVRPDGIFKNQNNRGYRRLSHTELHNLYRAVQLYCRVVPPALQRLVNGTETEKLAGHNMPVVKA